MPNYEICKHEINFHIPCSCLNVGIKVDITVIDTFPFLLDYQMLQLGFELTRLFGLK